MTGLQWENRIVTNVYNSIFELCPNVVNTSSNDITTFPTVDISLLSGTDTNVDLENNDCGATLTYEVQVYTQGSLRVTQNQTIMDAVYKAFKRMGFYMNYLNSVRNVNDATVFRRVARFKRYIGDGETIELIQRED
jgi:hypothetical protein